MVFKKILKLVLRGGEWFYRLGLKIHQWMYNCGLLKKGRVKARVISVGNLTWGGTGKTPLVILIARHLHEAGKRVAVLTRGYGNDEHIELKRRLGDIPVFVGKDKLQNARKAVETGGAEIVIVDDGFQHYALERDLDIVAINCTNPFGTGRLIPAGNLREPASALSRAHVFVLTQAFLGRHNVGWIRHRLRELKSQAPVFEADHQPLRFIDYRKGRPLPLDMVRGQQVGVLSAIEDPTSFENTITRLGAHIAYAARFNDHHVFRQEDMKEVFRVCHQSRVRYLVTTMKDSIRLKRLLSPKYRQPTRILVLQIEMRLNDEEALLRQCVQTSL